MLTKRNGAKQNVAPRGKVTFASKLWYAEIELMWKIQWRAMKLQAAAMKGKVKV